MPDELASTILFKFRFILITGFLAGGESEHLLELLRTKPSFCYRFFYYFSQEKPKIEGVVIGEDYLSHLIDIYQATEERDNFEKITAVIENFRNIQKPDLNEEFLDDDAYFEHLDHLVEKNELYDLQKATRDPRFEQFLANKTAFKFHKYALYHSIYCIKPLFTAQINPGEYRYRFSDFSISN
ncbi:MAG: hypothetical protein R2795_22250 [Saprospiraceae bacterium]